MRDESVTVTAADIQSETLLGTLTVSLTGLSEASVAPAAVTTGGDGGGDTPAETVTAAHIQSETLLGLRSVKKLTELQRAAARVVYVSGITLVVVILFIMVAWACTLPPAPAVPEALPAMGTAMASGTPAVATVIADYKAMSDAMVVRYQAINEANITRSTQILDSVGVKVLVPLFTLALGYLFGARNGSSEES